MKRNLSTIALTIGFSTLFGINSVTNIYADTNTNTEVISSSQETTSCKVTKVTTKGRSIYLTLDKELGKDNLENIKTNSRGFSISVDGKDRPNLIADVSVGDDYTDDIKSNVIAITLNFLLSEYDTYVLKYSNEESDIKDKDENKITIDEVTISKEQNFNNIQNEKSSLGAEQYVVTGDGLLFKLEQVSENLRSNELGAILVGTISLDAITTKTNSNGVNIPYAAFLNEGKLTLVDNETTLNVTQIGEERTTLKDYDILDGTLVETNNQVELIKPQLEKATNTSTIVNQEAFAGVTVVENVQISASYEDKKISVVASDVIEAGSDTEFILKNDDVVVEDFGKVNFRDTNSVTLNVTSNLTSGLYTLEVNSKAVGSTGMSLENGSISLYIKVSEESEESNEIAENEQTEENGTINEEDKNTSTSEEPNLEEPSSEEPSSEEPNLEEPSSEDPSSEEPTSEDTISEDTISEEPTSEDTISEEPTSEEPISEEPSSEEPTSEEPISEEPNLGGSSSGGSSSGGSSSGGSTSEGSSSKETVLEENASEEIVSEEITSEETVLEEIISENDNLTLDTESNIEEIKDSIVEKVNLPKLEENSEIKFNDISENYWAKDSIEKLAKLNIINGDGEGEFNPKGNTKRADIVIMLVKLLGLEGTPESNFNDVSEDKYYYNYLGIAKENGIINGHDGNFKPEENITRQDAMVMIANILSQLDLLLNTNISALQNFNDYDLISDYAKESVASLINLGIVNGNNGNINPKDYITRAEVSILISQIYDLIDNQLS